MAQGCKTPAVTEPDDTEAEGSGHAWCGALARVASHLRSPCQ
ncbi:MAG: hypothetical protein Q4B40_04310 [Clostridia bacterium]|nr:hypothetical protein [Clostridia bacterium]